MVKTKKGHQGYYYTAEFGSFGGIFFWPHEDRMPDRYDPDGEETWSGNMWGPFQTFTQAKRDAMEYFQTDIRESRRALDEVKKSLKVQDLKTGKIRSTHPRRK